MIRLASKSRRGRPDLDTQVILPEAGGAAAAVARFIHPTGSTRLRALLVQWVAAFRANPPPNLLDSS
jgi:hypothetical protein